MNNCLSITNWLEFINILFRGVYPVIFILVIIAFINHWQRFIKNKFSRFLIILFILSLFIRFLKYFSKGWLSERYLEPMILIITPFAVQGLYDLTKWINHKIISKKYKVPTQKIFIILLIAIAGIMTGKILRPHRDKPWFLDMKNIINKQQDILTTIEFSNFNSYALVQIFKVFLPNINTLGYNTAKPLIITNDPDIRLGYYSNAHLIFLNIKTFDFENVKILTAWNGTEFDTKKYIPGINNFYKNLSKLNSKHIYLFLNRVDPNTFKNEFLSKGLPFRFKLLKKYKDRHDRPVNFYEYIPRGIDIWQKCFEDLNCKIAVELQNPIVFSIYSFNKRFYLSTLLLW